jgi:hypothetical protein
MSSNLFKIITDLLKLLHTKRVDISKVDVNANVNIIFLANITHSLYAYGTSSVEDITIANKYKMVNHGSTMFMIHDENGRHYNVNNSFWYWKWDSVEDWSKINKGDRVKVKYYGIRSPLLGLFPNIVRSHVL